jgi:uncharacterized protein YndB with AHSA1/START domain
MSFADKTAPGQIETIAFEYDLEHPPAKVWRALTEPELLAEWLLPVIGFKLDAGAEFTYQTQAYPGWDGTVNCQMLEIEPQRKLRYTWTVPFLDTVVTFTLTPIRSGTRLSIVQSGFKAEQKRESGGARYGWKMMGGKLVELLARLP